MDKIIRRKALCELVGLSYSSVYRRVRRGQFPAPIVLGSCGQAIGWFEYEVLEWLRAQRRVALPRPGDDGADNGEDNQDGEGDRG